MLHAMQEAGVEPNVSIKLTQFGLDLSESACAENVAALVKAAAGIGGFVRIDMEGSAIRTGRWRWSRECIASTGLVGL